MIWNRRKKAARPRHDRLNRAIESLEPRTMLTTLAGGDLYRFQQSPGVYMQIQLSGSVMAEFVGAVVDDTNEVILTDLPGRFINSSTGRAGADMLGGVGGRDGIIKAGTANGKTTVTMNNGNVLTQNNHLNMENLASSVDGRTWTVNVATVNTNGQNIKYSQVVEIDPATGAGTERSSIGAATLDDLAATVAANSFNDTIGDMAVDPFAGAIDPISGLLVPNPTYGFLYVLTRQGWLYTVDRDLGTVTQIGQLSNLGSGVTLDGSTATLEAMAFDAQGNLFVMTRDYDSAYDPADDTTDASDQLINNQPLPTPPPTPGTVFPNKSAWDVAMLEVDKLTAQFTDAGTHLVTDPAGFELTNHYTALIWNETDQYFYAATQEIGGGGTGSTGAPPWELHRWPMPTLGTAAPVVAENRGDIVAGGGAGGGGGSTNNEVHGFAYTQDLWNNDILVAIEHTTVNTVRVARLITLDPNTPGAASAITQPGAVRLTRGIAGFQVPGEIRPTLYTVTGGVAGAGAIYRGSAVSLGVDTSGVSTVTSVLASDFNPLNGLMYFVVDQTLQGTAGQYLMTIDVNGTNRTAIQNSLQVIPGTFNPGNGAWQIQSIVFDQTDPFTVDLLAYGVRGNGKILRVPLGNTNGVTSETDENVPLAFDCDTPFAGNITGLSLLGDDPDIFPGDNPDAAEQFVYASVNGGGNSYMIRIRRRNPGHVNGSATAMVWGMLPDPDDPPAGGVRGQDIRGLTWNPNLTNPFTFEPGALMGTDVSTDELVYIDHRLRSPVVNIFNITAAQSDADAWMYISEYVPRQANVIESFDRIVPFTGDTGSFSVVNIPGPDPFTLVNPNPGTGQFLLGLKTRNVNCNDPWEALRPILPAAPGYELVAPTTGSFGMVPDGNGFMPQGFFIKPGGLVQTVNDYTGQMVGGGLNIDRVTGASVRNDGLIALIDSDHINQLVQAVPDRGDQLAIMQPGAAAATFIIDVTDPLGNHLGPVSGLDWGDPDGDGIEELYAIYTVGAVLGVGGTPTLGTIDIANGVFTPIGPVAPMAAVKALAFSPDQRLYVADATGGLHELDPATGNYVRYVADVPTVGSMDFSLSGILYVHDTAAGRLVSVDVQTGQVGTQVATAANSLRASVGAISYDPTTREFIGLDNALSREIIGDGTAGLWSTEGSYLDSSMLVHIRSAINEAVLPQDIGAARFGGTVMGQVEVSGSIEDFYAGWAPIGASGGQYLTAPTVPQNFRAGGEIRDVLVLDSIGTHDASAYRGSVYSTGFDAFAGGRIQEIVSREDIMGSVRAVNNGVVLPGTRIQQELESRDVGLFGNPAYNVFWNDSTLRPQYLGTIDGVAGSNVVQVQGTLLNITIPHTDLVDRYSVSLMAGQSVVVKLTPLSPLTNAYVGVFDPDARLIATDYSDIDPAQYHYQRFTFTADRPGVYEFAVGGAIPNPDFSTDVTSIGPYELLVSASDDGVTAGGPGAIALGAIMAERNVFDGRATGNPWRVDSGDFGAMVAHTRVASMTFTAGSSELAVLANPMDAITNPSIRVDTGNLRAVDGGSVGILNLAPAPSFDLGVDVQAINGSVGLIRSIGSGANDATVVNDDLLLYGTPAVSDHDIPGLHRDAAVGFDYQMVSAESRFYGALMADRSIGTVRSRIHDYLAGGLPMLPGWFVANADQVGDDGIIGLISSEGDIGNPASGGPAVMTGPGGDLKYMYSGGVAYRDIYFGGGTPEQTLSYPGESPSFNDDSGAVVRFSPLSPTDQMLITTYPVRGSGGVAVVEVITPGSVQVGGRAEGGAAGVQIGNIRASGPIVQIDGTAPVDVFNITGGAFQSIINSTDGEFVNITAGSIGRLEAGSVGVPRKVAGVDPAHIVVRTNAFPFAQQRISINSGTIGYVHATHAIGNLNVAGNIDLIYADADRQRVAGEFHGIVAPVYATGNITDVTLGEGLTSSGNGNLAHSGIYADGRIGIVRGDNANIRGNIISQAGIDRIQLTNGGSIINANIEVLDDRSASREWTLGTTPEQVDPVNLPDYVELGAVMVSGPDASRQVVGGQMVTVPAYNGGIIGSLFYAADMGDVDVTRGYGIMDSAFAVIGDGRMKDFTVDGYGIRDVSLALGAAMGRMYATGNGEFLLPTDYSAAVRQSQYGNEFIQQYSEFDNASRFEPNRTTDLGRYLFGAGWNDTDNILNAGIIAGTTVKASRTMDELEAWQVRPSTRLGVYVPSDFDIGSSIKLFTTVSDVVDMELTTGGITRMTIGRDLVSPSITVAGIFSELKIGRDYSLGDKGVLDHNIIEAIGNNGEISSIDVGRNVDGLIFAQRRIGNVRVRGQFLNGARIMEKTVQVAP